MPECTAAERALLEHVVRGESSQVEHERLLKEVRAERVSPELREQLVRLRVRRLKDHAQEMALWEQLGVPFNHNLYADVEAEAKQRLAEKYAPPGTERTASPAPPAPEFLATLQDDEESGP